MDGKGLDIGLMLTLLSENLQGDQGVIFKCENGKKHYIISFYFYYYNLNLNKYNTRQDMTLFNCHWNHYYWTWI